MERTDVGLHENSKKKPQNTKNQPSEQMEGVGFSCP